MVSSCQRRHAQKVAVSLLLHLLEPLQKFLPLVRCYFSSPSQLHLGDDTHKVYPIREYDTDLNNTITKHRMQNKANIMILEILQV